MFEPDLDGLKKRASAEAEGLVVNYGLFRDADAIGRLAYELKAVGYPQEPQLRDMVVAELHRRAADVRRDWWGG
jgi:hypothetical protein